MNGLKKAAKFMSDHTALVVIAFAVVTFIWPAWMGWVNHAWFTDFATNKFTSQTFIIGIIMMSMGMSMTTQDFKILAQRPLDIFIGAAAQYGVIPGKIKLMYARDQDYDRTAFVYRLYVDCLERAPETAGLEHWCQMLQNGMSGTNVASGFVFSPEFVNANYSNTEFVTKLYKVLLGRDPDAQGLANWVDALNRGVSRQDVFYGFAHSEEFTRICTEYGIVRG